MQAIEKNLKIIIKKKIAKFTFLTDSTMQSNIWKFKKKINCLEHGRHINNTNNIDQR